MTVSIQGVDKVHVFLNGVNIKQALSAANETVNKGLYDPTTLSTVDTDLATGNIKSGITIFGKVGSASVLDVSDADAAVTDVKDPRTFYSVTGPRKTGTMPTVAIVAGNDNYPAGYHAGDAGGLDAIDLDLAVGNIKTGVNIFGKVGTYDTTASAPTAAQMISGRVAFANGAQITGTMPTVTIASGSNSYLTGYHAGAAGLSTIEASLAAANIKSGINIFGFVGPATVQDISAADAAVGEVLSAKTFFSVTGAIKTGTMPTVALLANNSAYPTGYHAGAASLQAVDADLAVGNIKTGVNIFGYVGTYDTTASAPTAAQMISGRVAWANGAQITGTMPTVTIASGSNNYPTGYHAGAAGLSTIEASLAAANIKSGVNIFGFVGPATVQDISAANATVAQVLAANTFFSVSGAIKTGTMPTVALDPAANAYPAGYHAGAASLTAVDADLAAGNIKSGVTIFGVAGTFVSTLAEDLISNVWGPLSNDTNYFTQSIAAGGDYTIVTTTPTFAANSMAVAAGFAECASSEANSFKLRLFMGGVQMGESAYLAVWTNISHILLRATKALSGAQTCYLSCHNYYALDKLLRLLYTANVGEQSMSGIIVGSIKLV